MWRVFEERPDQGANLGSWVFSTQLVTTIEIITGRSFLSFLSTYWLPGSSTGDSWIHSSHSRRRDPW